MNAAAAATRASRAAWVLCAATALLVPLTVQGQGPMKRGMGTSSASLLIDGAPVGGASVTGGTPVAEVATSTVGPDGTTRKHVTSIRFEDIVAEAPLDSKPLSSWVSATLAGQNATRNGSIVGGGVLGERSFEDGVITEVAFPALDAVSRDMGAITVTIAPERVRYSKGSGAAPKAGPVMKGQRWTTNAFRVEMDGVDASKVSRVEPITFRREFAASQVGIFREPGKAASTTTLSNIRLTMPEAAAQPWVDWQQEFLINGKHGEADEKNGAIVLLSNDMKSEVARISLASCGIVRLAPAEGGNQPLQRVTAELYCERIGFQANGQ